MKSSSQWLVDVGFGNPAQTLKVVLDTGSAVAWTYSPQCCYQENHAFFDPTKSSTYVNRTLTRNGTAVHAKDGVRAQRWNTTYGGDSTTSGYLGYDTMRFGGNQLRIDDVEVGLAQRISGSRARRAMEGLLGFGPGVSSGVQGGWQTPFEALVQDKKLDRPVLSAVLIKANPETGKGGGGHYTFGAVDTTLVAGGEKAVRWANVTSSLYWGSNFEGMSIGNRQISSSNDSDRFVVDTGVRCSCIHPR